MRGRILIVVTSSAAGLVIIASSLLLMFNMGIPVANSLLMGLRITTPPIDNRDHLYVLDGWGGIHPVGSAPALKTSVSWPTKDIAFSLALFPDATGGYVMDGWGKLHSAGSAPAVDSNVYWPNWIGAREVVMAPWSSSRNPAGYLLDADGGIHPFGGAPAVTGNATWPSQGIARGIVLSPNSTPAHVSGYTLDGFGGVHPFGGARPVVGAAHWSTDIARGIALVKGANGMFVDGYTLDYSGGIHPFGGAPLITTSMTWPGQDEADSIVAWSAAPADRPGGWVLDRHGDIHPWGSASPVVPSQTWPGWDIARGLAGPGGGAGSTERTILDAQPLSDDWGSYYNQRDSRWASSDVGAATFPVWKIGCLLSDLAMVYSHFGVHSVTPGTIAAHTDWFNGNGAIFNSALHVPGHTTSIVDNPDPAWIHAQVAAGHPVIVGMNLPSGTTHFVTLTGLDGASDYWTDDPWEQNAMHVTFSGDWFTRGPIYEAIVFI
ncbi:MAG TPA: hypothetical protein VFR33_01575 [Candidatus Dormibacteraeota bacterium]|nr:hypothetical protein [Candidatus Dormibacteraeota bacterium]